MRLAVIDGANPESDHCGFIDMGEKHIAVPRLAFDTWDQKKDLYVYLQSGGHGVSAKLATSYPRPTQGKLRRLLARLIYRDGAYSVVQEQHGPIIENYHVVLGGL